MCKIKILNSKLSILIGDINILCMYTNKILTSNIINTSIALLGKNSACNSIAVLPVYHCKCELMININNIFIKVYIILILFYLLLLLYNYSSNVIFASLSFFSSEETLVFSLAN